MLNRDYFTLYSKEIMMAETTDAITKAALSRLLKCARSRISQLVGSGLPVLDGGRVSKSAALRWIISSVSDSGTLVNRAQELLKIDGEKSKPKQKRGRSRQVARLIPLSELEQLRPGEHYTIEQLQAMTKADLERLLLVEKREAQRLRNLQAKGILVSRADVEHSVESRAAAEKEALLNWPARVTDRIAAKLGVEPRIIHQFLDTEVRQFLTERSSMKIDEPAEEEDELVVERAAV
jgi:phage terminase Nu1 subunit (DNA packaging protein)